MRLLEDIIVLTLRLRQQGFDVHSIAEQLHHSPQSILQQERRLRTVLRDYLDYLPEREQDQAIADSYCGLSPLVLELGLQYYTIKPRKRFSKITREERVGMEEKIKPLADEGRSLAEIGKEVGLSMTSVQKILSTAGLFEYWKAKRTESKVSAKVLLSERTQFCSLLKARLYQQSQEAGWPYQKALEYDRARKIVRKNSIALPFLIRLFSEYEAARQRREKLPYQQLAQRAGISHASKVSMIFRAVGVPSFYWNVEDKKSAISPKLRQEIELKPNFDS